MESQGADLPFETSALSSCFRQGVGTQSGSLFEFPSVVTCTKQFERFASATQMFQPAAVTPMSARGRSSFFSDFGPLVKAI